MSKYVKTQIICASCGAIRGESNHWFVVYQTFDQSGFASGAVLTVGGRAVLYAVMALDPEHTVGRDSEYPACGESCLVKIEQQLLSGKKSA